MEDKIKENREKNRQWLISFVGKHIAKKLVNYLEPQRKGVPKGDVIGYPRKKIEASMWMILYPHGLGLKEIGSFVGASYSLIGLWRHEEEFKRKIKDECDYWSRTLKTFIENEANEILTGERDDNNLVELITRIPFFADPVQKQITVLLVAERECASEAKDETASMFWASLLLELHRSYEVRDMKSFRKYMRDPEEKKITKDSIKTTLDLITNPKTRQKFSLQEIKEATESVKRAVEFYIDLA